MVALMDGLWDEQRVVVWVDEMVDCSVFATVGKTAACWVGVMVGSLVAKSGASLAVAWVDC